MDSIRILVQGGMAYLDPINDVELEQQIEAGTSYKPLGVEYTWAYKNKRNDGRVRLVRNGQFPAGLLPRVIDIIQGSGRSVSIESGDEATVKPRVETRIDSIQDRFYQGEAIAAATLNDRGVIRAPTGAGKTAIGALIVHARKLRTLVVVPTIDLLHQYRDFLGEHLRVLDGTELKDHGDGQRVPTQRFQPIGQLGDGVIDPQAVTVATIRTIAKVLDLSFVSYEYAEYDDRDETVLEASSREELREWIEAIGILIIDEAHILGAQMVYEVTNKIPALVKIGMSASPWRDDGADLMIEAATGQVIYRIDPKVLVEHKFLVPPIIRVISTRKWWQPAAWGKICKRCGRQNVGYNPECPCGSHEFKSQFTECYKNEIVENGIRNQRIADEVQALGVPTLVLVKQVKHGKALEALIPGSKFLSGVVRGESRYEAFQAMRAGELQVIIATTIADLGMDIPNLEALVLAGGGKSSTRHLQRIGRVVRPSKGKTAGLVIDFDDSHCHRWFAQHEKARRKIEAAEWGGVAIWC